MSHDAGIPNFEEWVEYLLTYAVADERYLWEGPFVWKDPLGWPREDDPILHRSRRFSSSYVEYSPMSVAQEARYRMRLLEDPQPMFAPYTEDQIATAVDFLFESGDAFHEDILGLPFSGEFLSQYLDALAFFYVRFFDKPVPGADKRTWCDRLHYTAFMMWDGKGPSYFPAEAQLHCLSRILRECESEDCFQCALHGLGHLAWYEEWRPACAEIVDRFLAERMVTEGTRKYALRARVGEGV